MDPPYASPSLKQNRQLRFTTSKRKDLDTDGSFPGSLRGVKSGIAQSPWNSMQLPDDNEPETFLQQHSGDLTNPGRYTSGPSSRPPFHCGPNIIRTFGRKPTITRSDVSRTALEPANQPITNIDASNDLAVEHATTTSQLRQCNSFQILETRKVTLFLQEKLIKLQQQVCKKIAKAWIKEICPKKQARCPYSKKGGVPDQPEWWPPLDKCIYKEPDHLAKPERVNLLIHLLRLRPSPQQVKEWLGDIPDTSRANPMSAWTRFLKEKTPSEVLTDLHLPSEPENIIRERSELLNSLFKVAEMEEDYVTDGRDGTDTIAWTPDMKKLNEMNLPLKRSRPRDVADVPPVIEQSCIVPEANLFHGAEVVQEPIAISRTLTPSEASSNAKQEKAKRKFEQSDTSSESSSRARAKRVRKDSIHCNTVEPKRSKRKRDGNAVDNVPASRVDTPINETSASSSPPFPPDCNLLFPAHMDSKPTSYQDAAFNSSFGSTHSDWYNSDVPWHTQRSFAGDQVLGHPVMSGPSEVEVRRAYHGNPPQFQATPNLRLSPNMAHNVNTNDPGATVPTQIWYGGLPTDHPQNYEQFLGHLAYSCGGFRAYHESGENGVILDEQQTIQPGQLYGPNMQNVNNGSFDSEWSAPSDGPPGQYTCEAPLSYIPPDVAESWTQQVNWTPQEHQNAS